MTKIKNFRLTLRPREVARLLKQQRDVQITPELEASIEHAVQDAKRFLEPAAVYTTLTKGTAGKTMPIAFSEGAISVSVLAVTVGPKLGEERQAAGEQDPLQAPLLAAIEQEAVGQAVQFVMRLVTEQAKEE